MDLFEKLKRAKLEPDQRMARALQTISPAWMTDAHLFLELFRLNAIACRYLDQDRIDCWLDNYEGGFAYAYDYREREESESGDVFLSSISVPVLDLALQFSAGSDTFGTKALLVCAAAAVGNTRQVELKSDWPEPSILWGAIVGLSGSTKSPVFDKVVQFVRKRQRQAFEQHKDELEDYKRKRLAWNQTPKAGRNPDDHPGDCPQAERFLVSDITIEALAVRLENSPRGVLVFTDELAGWVKGFGQYKRGSGNDVESWIALHGGRSLTIDRKTGDKQTIHIERAAVCVLGGIQPGTLRRCFTTDFYENGLAARVLLVWPPGKCKRWSEAEISPEALQAMADIFGKLYGMEMTEGFTGRPTPGIVRPDIDAKRAFKEYYNKHNAELEQLTSEAERAFYAKLEGGAARLALVVHCLRWACDESVDPFVMDVQSMTAGITLAQWFKHEALRVYRLLHADPVEKCARLLAEWISQRGGSVTARDLQNAKGTRFPRSGDAHEALEALVQRGWGKWQEKPPGPKGGRGTIVFVLNPATTYDNCDTTPPDSQRDAPAGSSVVVS